MKTFKVTIEDSDGYVVVYDDVKEKDFFLELNNDLEQVPALSGVFEQPPYYSKGYHFVIRGYVKNPKEKEEMEEAINKTIKNSGLV